MGAHSLVLLGLLGLAALAGPAECFLTQPLPLAAYTRACRGSPLAAPRAARTARPAGLPLPRAAPRQAVGGLCMSAAEESRESALVPKQPASAAPWWRLSKTTVALSVLLAVSALFLCSTPVLAAAKAKAVAAPAGNPAILGLKRALKFVLHLDKELAVIIAKYGKATYAILFAIVFAETGLVVTPFLPGDSLLFACGALAALGSLNLPLTAAIFLVAAILGDAVNYSIGNFIGPKAFESDTWFLKKKNLKKTEQFYDKYGGKTIVLARFVPIVRTFAPFVAGVGSMKYSQFAFFNVLGAVVWTVLFVGAGFVFGNIPAVQHNFTLVVVGIVVVSVLPVVWEVIQARKEDAEEDEAPPAPKPEA